VLSGYLITSRLLEENRIDLKRFYVRRFFRLMPCAWLYLAFLAGFAAATGHTVSTAWSCVFFFRNYMGRTPNMDMLTEHFWSLSIEEQFYLVWPVVLVVLGRARGAIAAAVGFVAFSIFTFWNWRAYEGNGNFRTEVNAHSLLAGCVLALIFQYPSAKAWVAHRAGWLLAVSVPGVIWHVAHANVDMVVFPTESVLIAVMLAATSAAPGHFLSRLVEWKPLAGLGKVSYSVYVWQTLFLIPPLGWIGLMLLPMVALGSWALIERF
jgi:peptidoglycan/LPS O-acetylase OafA/YrhL